MIYSFKTIKRMKKYFIMAVTAIAAFAFVGCKQQNTPDAPVTGAKVSIAESLELAVGAEEKLRYTLNPVKEGLVVSFTSDNKEVATVTASGIVTGVAPGQANIIASAEGYESDTCVVTVLSEEDAFAWGSMGLFDISNTPLGEAYIWTSSWNGKEYLVRNYTGTFYIWSSTIIFTNGVGFAGSGFMNSVKCPVAIIQEGSPNGTAGSYIGVDLTFDDTLPADSMGVCAAGSLTDPEAWHSYLFDSTYVGENPLKGTALHYVDWDNQDNSIDFVGFIKDGWVGEYSNGIFYKMNITWFDMSQGIYGLKMEQDATTGQWSFVKPYTFTDRQTIYYEEMPEASEGEAAAPKKMMVITKEAQKQVLKKITNSDVKMHKMK